MTRLLAPIVWLFIAAGPLNATSAQTEAGRIEIAPVLTGLIEPWSIGFLPDGTFLVTERAGRLIHAGPSGVVSVTGLPDIAVTGQGGLLDVLVPGDFSETREIMFSYARSQGRSPGTALAVARLPEDGQSLEDVRTIFSMESPSGGGRHFGSRIVEASDGTIFLTLGERGDADEAQSLASHNGTVVRIDRDGTIPADNPFIGTDGALPEIWSYGHRNPQGAALDLDGQLWVNEHGAMGGDEVNRVEKGANYGWPVIAYGRHYSGFKIGEGTEKPGMEQPRHYWDPSIAPSGLMIYSGALWPEWRGDFFTGSLKFDYLSRLDPDNGWAEEQIKTAETGRVRDVREAPDGSIWFVSVDNGAVYRIVPGS